jgi:hypothetical protein
MKMLSKIIGGSIGIAAVLAFSASTTQAASLLVNGSFETAGQFLYAPITLATVNQGWDVNFGGATAVQSDMSSAASSPLDGSYALLTENNPGNNWNPRGGYQVVSGGDQVGSLYTLSVYALRDANTPLSGTYGTPIDVQLQFFNAGLTNIQTTETGWTALGTVGTWQSYTVSGTAPAGAVYAAAYLMFMDNGQTSPDYVYFDNATLTVVPEPSTLALLGMGLAVPFYFIRRRKS